MSSGRFDGAAAAGLSVLVHAAAVVWATQGRAASPREPAPPSEIAFEFDAPPPAPPPPPPPVEAEPVEVAPAPRRPTPRRVARQTAPEPQAAPETAPPPEDAPPPAPVALGGLTLTGAGSGWSVGAGPGGRAGAPSRRGSAMAAAPVAAAPAAPAGPRLVREGDLSRRPRQPSSLASLLDQLYPAGARSRGEEGLARVRVRIGADGRARPMAVAYASAAPFGTACRQLLARSRGWQPGRDEDGNRVDTIIEFPCRFEVRP